MGAFGVVLEVKNKVTHEISALKVNIANHLLNRSDYQSGKLAALWSNEEWTYSDARAQPS